MEPLDERNGDLGRMSRRNVDQLEIEIHAEKVRVWVDGASTFLKDDKNVAILAEALGKILDKWFMARSKTALAAFGLTMLGALIVAGLGWLGWKGWAGPGGGR
jgi:hypothetical protein